MMGKNEKVDIRGLLFSNVTLDEAAQIISAQMAEKSPPFVVYTPNAEIAQMCIEDEGLMQLFNSADMLVPDGSGILLAAKVLARPLKGKVAGVEVGERLLSMGAAYGWRFYFLGGRPVVANEAADKMTRKYPGLVVCGTHDGYFKKEGEENERILESIRASSPDVLFVCFGAPAQERWIAENKHLLPSVKVCLGLGGSFDIYAGRAKRAPRLFIMLRLEWFYRLLRHPSRIGRMMRLPRYVIGTFYDKVSSGKGNL